MVTIRHVVFICTPSRPLFHIVILDTVFVLFYTGIGLLESNCSIRQTLITRNRSFMHLWLLNYAIFIVPFSKLAHAYIINVSKVDPLLISTTMIVLAYVQLVVLTLHLVHIVLLEELDLRIDS